MPANAGMRIHKCIGIIRKYGSSIILPKSSPNVRFLNFMPDKVYSLRYKKYTEIIFKKGPVEQT